MRIRSIRLIIVLMGFALPLSLVQASGIDPSSAAIRSNWAVKPQPAALTDGTLEPSIVSISCAPEGFCGAVTSDGRFISFEQGVGRHVIFGSIVIDSSGSLTGVSCPTSNFCAAVDNTGNLLQGNPRRSDSWSIVNVGGSNSLLSVSCPSVSFCAALDASGVFLSSDNVSDPNSWERTQIPVRSIYSTLRCPTAVLCLVGDVRGNLWSMELRNSSWVWLWLMSDLNASISSIDCHGDSLCSFSDTEGGIGVWAGGPLSNWVRTRVARSALAAVTCGSDTSCVSVGVNGVVWSTQNPKAPETWRRVARLSNPHSNSGPWASLSAASCWADGGCILGDRMGDTATEGASANFWKIRKTADLATSRRVNCLSVQECISINGTQEVVSSTTPFSTNTSWSPVRVEGTRGAFLVDSSCETSSTCIAVDSFGSIFQSNDYFMSWSKDAVDPGVAFTSATCSVGAFCVATSEDGSVFVGDPSRNSSWMQTQVEPLNSGAQLTSVSCTPSRLCAAVDDAGNIFTVIDPTLNGGKWNSGGVLGLTALQSISCSATLDFCAAIGPSHVIVWSYSPEAAGSWFTTPVVGLPFSSSAALSCSGTTSDINCAVISGSVVKNAIFDQSLPPKWSRSVSPDGVVSGVSCFATSACVAASQHGFILKAAASDLRSPDATWTYKPNHIQINLTPPLASADLILLTAIFPNGKITRIVVPGNQTVITISNRDNIDAQIPNISVTEQWIVGTCTTQAIFQRPS